MDDESRFLKAVEAIPQDMVARVAFADWLEERGRGEEAKFLRLVEMTGEEFHGSIVAQDDDGDYDESGYVVLRVKRSEREYALFSGYSHCSCFDTWASICSGGVGDYYEREQVMQPAFDWVGSWDGFRELAVKNIDPNTGREISDDNYNRDHLEAVYAAILKEVRPDAAE